MRTNARVGRSMPRLHPEGKASLAVAASALLLVRLSAALRPVLHAGERLRAAR